MMAEKQTENSGGIRYLAPLDGIRAIAIIGVLAFHAAPDALRGGFTGVDVFFVLSGFLITAIIQRDLAQNEFRLGEFFLRRVQRLLPNVIAVVLFVLLAWKFLMPPGSVLQPAQHGLWALFNLSNIYVWRSLGGYWDSAAEWAPLTHTWSLGVEEQFYLVYPLCLMVLSRVWARGAATVLGGAALISFGLSLYGTSANTTATFYLLPTRMWELLLGALVATHVFSEAREHSAVEGRWRLPIVWFGWIGLALIVISFVTIDKGVGFPGVWAAMPTLGSALVVYSVASSAGRLASILSHASMVEVGKRSYSLYLWHWPLVILGKSQAQFWGLPPAVGTLGGALIGILLGWIVYDLVEVPLRGRGPGRGLRFGIIAGAFGIVAILGLTFATRMPVIDSRGRFDEPVFSGKLYDSGRPTRTDLSASVRYLDVGFPSDPHPKSDAWRDGGVIRHYGASSPAVVVLGSSHALMYSRVIDELCWAKGETVAFLAQDGGTPAFFEAVPNVNLPTAREAKEFDDTRRRWLQQWRPKVVIVIDRWDLRFTSETDFERRLRSFLTELAPWSETIVFVSQVPVLQIGENINLRGLVDWKLRFEKELPPLFPDGKEGARQQVARVAERVRADFPQLSVLRVERLFYHKDAGVRYAAGRSFYYADDNHLTDAGAEVARGLFESVLR